ncbi:MAG TPA: hypothetical protein VHY84_00255 [Bryobacteraceae bacterium]|jgi:hypothetical protein|nr:hypothetical protein [Bryobacteraceae bacterium]
MDINLDTTSESAGNPMLRDYLERNVWPIVPAAELGRVLNREQEDEILGYGPEGF